MVYTELGHTGIKVSRLCFGTLTLGPGQKGLGREQGTALLSYALEQGINFFDTAEIYRTYSYLRPLLKSHRSRMVIASKSYAVTRADMQKSLGNCLSELGVEEIDLFLLHEQESELTLRGHAEAWEELIRAKERGLVRAIGLSTHYPAGVSAGTALPDLDVIHPLINMAGMGIAGGGREDMLKAIRQASDCGKGIYAMKALAGGHLYRQAREALHYAFNIPGVHSVAVGMQTETEISYNCRIAEGGVPEKANAELPGERRLHVEDWCTGCGECAAACPQEALSLSSGRVHLTGECILCGYCALACKNFCLKVI
ncbi:MAG: aldo/keto reductase [Bacillota bacterium]